MIVLRTLKFFRAIQNLNLAMENKYQLSRVIFPAKIAGKICQIEADIVKENIPLLSSKNSLERCGTVIDLNNDKATIFNKKIDLHFSSSGHYCINIVPEFKTTDMCKKVLVLESELSSKSKFNQIKKIHAQFGHASKDSMEKILKDANL